MYAVVVSLFAYIVGVEVCDMLVQYSAMIMLYSPWWKIRFTLQISEATAPANM
jgi:hypothetical protein